MKRANELKIYDSNVKGPQGLVCPHTGATYMYVAIIFKDLFSNRSADQSQIL